MIPREKLEALAKVMGGEYVHPGLITPGFARWYGAETIIMDCECGRMDEVNPVFTAHEEGYTAPGTLESLEEKVREWVDAKPGRRFLSSVYRGGESADYLSIYEDNIDGPSGAFNGTKLSALIDAVLWVSQQDGQQQKGGEG